MQTERSDEKRVLSLVLADSIRRQPDRTPEEWRAIDAVIDSIPDDDPHKLEVRQARMEIVRRGLK